MTELRVLVADDHPIYREGIVAGLGRQADMQVVAECATADEARDRILELAPEVALLDQKMPGPPVLEVVETVQTAGSPTRIVIVTAFADGAAVLAALEAGVAGFLSKDASRDAIAEAVRRVAAGDTVVAPEVQRAMSEELRARRDRAPNLLSDREQEVLALLADGRSTGEIAEQLIIGPATVKTHLHHLYEKLGVSDRAAAVAEGMRRGLLR